MKRNQRTNRRSYLKTLGILGTTGLGSTGLTTAKRKGNGNNKGGKKGLDPVPLGFILNYSTVGSSDHNSNEPNEIGHYGYPPSESSESGALYYGGKDDGEMFDITNIELTPNGNTLHHSLQFFAGMLISDDSKLKEYILVHRGDGRYVSRGQVMNLKTRTGQNLLQILKQNIPEFEDLDELPPPFSILTSPEKELSWRAACSDRIQLVTDDEGNPTTTPEWGITRTDFYSRGRGKPEFTISLLYTIWNPLREGQFSESAAGVMINELISPGRLNLGGQ